MKLNAPLLLLNIALALLTTFFSATPALARQSNIDATKEEVEAIDTAIAKGDYSTAAVLLKPLAERGVLRAQRALGIAYLEGRGVAQDAAEGRKWLKLAADSGELDSQFTLAMMYKDGIGSEKNEYVASHYLALAAAQGDYEASFELGKLYDPGIFEGDTPKITILSRQSKRPANMVEKNAVEAARWYRQAASAGASGAQYNLGNLYAQGIGVPRDYAQAANLYRLAARQGSAPAQTDLGALYSKGLGVTENNYKGYLWSIIAAASGDDQAIINRDVLAGRLSAAERSAAERQAAACVEAKFQLEICN
ncbi:MAG: sel1 repeat family protein [Erythrobacter sp.]|nr:sel1 repeat family protein [Erythrobacter sp.]